MSDKITLSFPNCFLKGKSIHMNWYSENIIGSMKTVFPIRTVTCGQLLNPFSFQAFSPFSSQIHTPSVLTTLRPPSPFSQPHLLFLLSPLIIAIFAINFFPVPISFYLSPHSSLLALIFSSHSLQIPHYSLSVSTHTSLCPQTSKNQVIRLELGVLLCLRKKREGGKGQCRRC